MDTGPAKHPSLQRSNGSCLLFAVIFGVLLCVGFVIIAGTVGGLVYFRSAQRQQLSQQQRVVSDALQAQVEVELARSELNEGNVTSTNQYAGPNVSNSGELPGPTGDVVVEITIDAEGITRVGSDPFDAPALRQHVQKRMLGGTRTVKAIIRADRRCSFGQVASVMAVCREIGVSNLEVKALGDP